MDKLNNLEFFFDMESRELATSINAHPHPEAIYSIYSPPQRGDVVILETKNGKKPFSVRRRHHNFSESEPNCIQLILGFLDGINYEV